MNDTDSGGTADAGAPAHAGATTHAMGVACSAVTIAGETLLLHPERAVLWAARRTVIVADTHFGKSALFRRHGLAVPAGSDQRDRERLSRLVRDMQARRLIVLGDFLHAPLRADSDDARDLTEWCRSMPDTDIHVIAGNHDRGAAGLWRPPLRWSDADLLEPPFRFTHDADRAAAAPASAATDAPRGSQGGPVSEGLFTLSGHIHPVVRLGGLRKHAPRVPVFWQRRGGLVLPSFGIFTGGYVVTPETGDRLFAAGPQRVVQFR